MKAIRNIIIEIKYFKIELNYSLLFTLVLNYEISLSELKEILSFDGLISNEINKRIQKFGLNELPRKKVPFN